MQLSLANIRNGANIAEKKTGNAAADGTCLIAIMEIVINSTAAILFLISFFEISLSLILNPLPSVIYIVFTSIYPFI